VRGESGGVAILGEVGGQELHHVRVAFGKRPADLLQRHVVVFAAVGDVLHVLATGGVEAMKDRIGATVELERRQAPTSAQGEIVTQRSWRWIAV